jgi:glycosyltransferase involved in cell wall biosynthesis
VARKYAPVRTTLIITSYNQPKSLPLVLEGIARQTRPVDEIIIADDGSRQPTFDAIEQCQARLKLPIKAVVTQEDLGFRKCVVLNKAILESTGQLLLFLDGDIVTPPHWVARHVEAYRPLGYTAGCYLRLNYEQSAEIAGKGLDHIDWPRYLFQARFNYELIKRCVKDDFGMLMGRYNKPRVAGGNLSVDRGLLFGVNGFDERYVGFGGEDADLRNRMNNYGGKPSNPTFRILALHLNHGLELGKALPRKSANYAKRDLSVYASSKKNVWAVEGLAARMAAAQPPAQV